MHTRRRDAAPVSEGSEVRKSSRAVTCMPPAAQVEARSCGVSWCDAPRPSSKARYASSPG
eukprot:scaffold62296_cov44-Phaeocystis_antarctica.AAC.1